MERKAYLATNSVESLPRLAGLFDRSKCENVVVRKEDCTSVECLRQDDCRLDRGSPFCYKASKDAHAMLDPSWLGGPSAVVKRAPLRWIFLLRNDAISPAAVAAPVEDALRILASGEVPGMARSAAAGPPAPFFNPHLLVRTEERLALQKSFFQRLLNSATVYLFNSGTAGVEKIKEIVGGR